jgi:multidrug efflux pump subunit AcrA (membrane-fusion protein)
MSHEPPWKRARSCVVAGRSAVQLGLNGSDASKFAEAARSVAESVVALKEALQGVTALHEQQQVLDALRERVQAAEEAVRERVKLLSAAEETLQRLELLASGTMTALCGNEEEDLVPLLAGVQPVSLRRLVQLARQISYSTAAPPLTPAGPISLMPLAPMMRMSTLYNMVPLLSDPMQPDARGPARQDQQPPPPPPPSQVVPKPTQQAVKPMPANLDLDLEDSADSSSSEESSSEASSGNAEEKDEENEEEEADEW